MVIVIGPIHNVNVKHDFTNQRPIIKDKVTSNYRRLKKFLKIIL